MSGFLDAITGSNPNRKKAKTQKSLDKISDKLSESRNTQFNGEQPKDTKKKKTRRAVIDAQYGRKND